jgi:hypothetical protein
MNDRRSAASTLKGPPAAIGRRRSEEGWADIIPRAGVLLAPSPFRHHNPDRGGVNESARTPPALASRGGNGGRNRARGQVTARRVGAAAAPGSAPPRVSGTFPRSRRAVQDRQKAVVTRRARPSGPATASIPSSRHAVSGIAGPSPQLSRVNRSDPDRGGCRRVERQRAAGYLRLADQGGHPVPDDELCRQPIRSFGRLPVGGHGDRRPLARPGVHDVVRDAPGQLPQGVHELDAGTAGRVGSTVSPVLADGRVDRSALPDVLSVSARARSALRAGQSPSIAGPYGRHRGAAADLTPSPQKRSCGGRG